MSKWKVTIQRSKTQRKQLTVSGPSTAKLAEAAALKAMEWDAKDCESVEAQPAGDDEPDAPTTIEVAQPTLPAKPTISELEDSAPRGPARKKRAARKK